VLYAPALATDMGRFKMSPATTQLWNARWYFATDMNGDGVFNFIDVWLMVKYVYFAPGDLLIFAHIADPELPTLFEPNASWLYGWASGVFSGIAWLLTLGAIGAITSAILKKSAASSRQ
jgi:hypothetical protein